MKNAIKHLLAAALLSLPLASPAAAETVRHPVVVELFTSQGCNSCPPAEAYLNELAERKDVIALEFHVDYWDYIGWRDPFASNEYTRRQKTYAANMGGRYVYTPQMVINGTAHEVGSRRDLVEGQIDAALAHKAEGRPALALSHGDGGFTIKITGPEDAGAYDLVMVTFDEKHVTEVTRGENSGKQLVNAHVVRSMKTLASWDGGDTSHTFKLPTAAGDGGCAVLLQRKGGGPIIAAAALDF